MSQCPFHSTTLFLLPTTLTGLWRLANMGTLQGSTHLNPILSWSVDDERWRLVPSKSKDIQPGTWFVVSLISPGEGMGLVHGGLSDYKLMCYSFMALETKYPMKLVRQIDWWIFHSLISLSPQGQGGSLWKDLLPAQFLVPVRLTECLSVIPLF